MFHSDISLPEGIHRIRSLSLVNPKSDHGNVSGRLHRWLAPLEDAMEEALEAAMVSHGH